MEIIVQFFLKRPYLAFLVVIIVAVLGIYSALSIRKEGFPNVTTNRILVTTVYPGASAKAVAAKVTRPIEKALGDLDRIREIVSLSHDGLSSLEAIIDDEATTQECKKVLTAVNKRLVNIDTLPKDFPMPPSTRLLSSDDLPIAKLAFSGERKLLKDILPSAVERLKRVDGVASSMTMGLLDREGLIVRNQGKPGASVLIKKKPKADIIETIRRVRDELDNLNLPDGVELRFLNDQSRLTRDRLSLVTKNAIIGFMFVLLLLFMVFDPRTAFWTAFGIPFSLLGALAIVAALGLSLNAVTLIGFLIVLGMLVDDAIVVGEHINALREQGLSPNKAAMQGVQAVWKPVFGATATSVIAFLPLLRLGGLPGKFIWIVPLVVIVALVISLVECCLLLPVHLSQGRSRTAQKKRFTRKMEYTYGRVLHGILCWRYPVIILSMGVLSLAGYIAVNHLKRDPFPQDAAEGFTIGVTLPDGSTLSQTEKVLKVVESQLQTLPKQELAAYSAHIGTQHPLTFVDHRTHDTIGIIFAYLTPLSSRNRTAEQIMKAIRQPLLLKAAEKQAQIVMELMRYGPPMGKPFEIRVICGDDSLRKERATDVAGFLTQLDGVLDVEVEDSEIRHVNGHRTSTVSGNLEKRKISPESVMKRVRKAFPSDNDVAIAFAGQPVENAKLFRNMHIAMLLALSSIYLVIALIFKSLFKPLIIMVAVPFGMAGIIVALLVHEAPLSAFAGTALIGLTGVVVNDSILMVYTLSKPHQTKGKTREALVDGAVSRLRPILLTTATTVLGILPAACAVGGYDPFLSPMCLSLAYGLVFGTLITLVLVPSLYAIGQDIGRASRKDRNISHHNGN